MALVLSVASGAAFAGPDLDFDRTFVSPGDRMQSSMRPTYYDATYRSGGQSHRVQVWRDGDRIRRRTDDAVETFLVRRSRDVEWTMTVLDLKRKMRTDVSRTNLYRIGHLVDWSEEADSLSRPRGAYRLTAAATPAVTAPPIAACRWYLLSQGGRSTTICWSAAGQVPLVILDDRGDAIWRVTQMRSGALQPGTFSIEDQGYVRNDADSDIQAD